LHLFLGTLGLGHPLLYSQTSTKVATVKMTSNTCLRRLLSCARGCACAAACAAASAASGSASAVLLLCDCACASSPSVSFDGCLRSSEDEDGGEEATDGGSVSVLVDISKKWPRNQTNDFGWWWSVFVFLLLFLALSSYLHTQLHIISFPSPSRHPVSFLPPRPRPIVASWQLWAMVGQGNNISVSRSRFGVSGTLLAVSLIVDTHHLCVLCCSVALSVEFVEGRDTSVCQQRKHQSQRHRVGFSVAM
jgi:hypothetical protein